MDEHERRTLEHIERFGCSVMHVMEDGDEPPFAYSVGITRSSAAPEVLVIGLRRELAHAMVNHYNQRVRAGERFVVGRRYSGFLDGFDVEVAQVDASYYRAYVGWDLWLYKGPSFEVLQLVYPDTRGTWPWQPEAAAGFKAFQPLLDPQLRARHAH